MSESVKRWCLMMRLKDGEMGSWGMLDNGDSPAPGMEFPINGDTWIVVDPFVTDQEDKRVSLYKLPN